MQFNIYPLQCFVTLEDYRSLAYCTAYRNVCCTYCYPIAYSTATEEELVDFENIKCTSARLLYLQTGNQGWQYGTVRSEFAYYVPCPYYSKKGVPYQRNLLLAKIEAYRTYAPYRTAILAFNN